MRLHSAIIIIVLAIFFGLVAGCGKKGPPYIPSQAVHLRAKALEARWTKDGVELEGVVSGPDAERTRLQGRLELRIFHTRYALSDTPCPSCPITYPGYTDKTCKLGAHGKFRCILALERKKGVYFFQVAVIGPRGNVGPLSEKTVLRLE